MPQNDSWGVVLRLSLMLRLTWKFVTFPSPFPSWGHKLWKRFTQGTHHPRDYFWELSIFLFLEFSRTSLLVRWIHQLGSFQPQVVLRIGRITGSFITSQNEIQSWSAGELAYWRLSLRFPTQHLECVCAVQVCSSWLQGGWYSIRLYSGFWPHGRQKTTRHFLLTHLRVKKKLLEPNRRRFTWTCPTDLTRCRLPVFKMRAWGSATNIVGVKVTLLGVTFNGL